MKKQDDSKGLLRVLPDTYGQDYRAHLLEQYKLFVATAERVSTSRMTANNYLLTVNAFLLSLFGLASAFGQNWVWLVIVPVAGILICITWHLLIQNYSNLNTAKFRVIHELEKHLPAALFDYEWDQAQKHIPKKYKQLTRIEKWIPMIFGFLYLILMIVIIYYTVTTVPVS